MTEAGEVAQQHLVSRVLIKRWSSDGRVLAVDLDHSHAQPKLKAPAAIGYKIDFIKAASKQWENRWRATENLAPDVFAAVDDRSIFDQPALIDAVKDLMAIHYARSHVVDLAWQVALGSVAMGHRQKEIAIILGQDGALDELFGHYTGLVPPHTFEPRRIALDRFARAFEARVGEGGLAFADAVGNAADRMRDILDRHSLDIGIAADDAEFVLSDSPVQPLDHTTRTARDPRRGQPRSCRRHRDAGRPEVVVAPGKQATFTVMPHARGGLDQCCSGRVGASLRLRATWIWTGLLGSRSGTSPASRSDAAYRWRTAVAGSRPNGCHHSPGRRRCADSRRLRVLERVGRGCGSGDRLRPEFHRVAES